MRRVYFDYAASTPVDPAVRSAMAPYFGSIFGNPHALHRFGQEASAAVFESRRAIANALGVSYRDIIFTASATEANNLAIRGVIKSYRTYKTNRSYKPRIVTSAIEHESVLETCRDLEREGLVEIIYIPVGKDGLVDPKKIKAALNQRTVLISIMHANNEVGTVQPISEISKIIGDFKKSHPERQRRIPGDSSAAPQNDSIVYPLLHTDAVQSFQYLDCQPASLGVDLMTISAHKIYGPKGIGALYVRKPLYSKSYILNPVITGSGQESGLRSGTDNVPYIVGFAKSVEIAEKMKKKESVRAAKLRDYFWGELKKRMPKITMNGSMAHRLPNNLNIYFPGQKAHELQIRLDFGGVAVSPGAACSTRVSQSSYVLEEMGFDKKRASGSLRFSLGRHTTKAEIDYAINVIKRSFGTLESLQK